MRADAPKSSAAVPTRESRGETLGKAILPLLASKRAADRARGIDKLLANWPDSKPVLEAALESRSARVRLTVTHVLRLRFLSDTTSWIRRRMADRDAAVRVLAVRAARHRRLENVEEALIRLVRKDPRWAVQQEALRALETLGTTECLDEVLCGWEWAENDDQRRRYKRVLVRIVGRDVGDDYEGWFDAIRAVPDTQR